MKDARSYLHVLASDLLAIAIGKIYPMKDERSYLKFLASELAIAIG